MSKFIIIYDNFSFDAHCCRAAASQYRDYMQACMCVRKRFELQTLSLNARQCDNKDMSVSREARGETWEGHGMAVKSRACFL